MVSQISAVHKEKFSEIRKKLALIGNKEEKFVTVELLFYETLTLARQYGDLTSENKLLSELKDIESNEYKATQEKFPKKARRERAIKHFMHRFRTLLADWEKAKAPLAGAF
jgi:hypothetical protein